MASPHTGYGIAGERIGMRRNEHLGARALALIGLLGGVAYLAWRLAVSMQGSPGWLAVPFYVVELAGLLTTGLLAWAMWPQPAARQPRTDVTARAAAVVRVQGESTQDLRATLLSLQAVRGIDQVVVVDLDGRPDIATLALEFQATYAAADLADRNGLAVMTAAVEAPQFLLFDAGDVPTADIVARLAPSMDDPMVAVVQGVGVSVADDSPEHGPDHRHELIFERSALNPALGRRGTAVWTGSGSLVRRAAVSELPADSRPPVEAAWSATSALHAAGWKIAALAGAPVLAHRDLRDARAVYDDRVYRVRAARRMVVHAITTRSLRPSQRLAALAWCVRPLSSLHRLGFIAVLLAAMLSGETPFTGSVPTLALLWLPYFAYTSLGVCLLSGWTLRPGDRARWSLHNLGATLRSSLDPATAPDRAPILNLPASQYGATLVAVVVVLSSVLLMRGVSDRFTHSMGVLPQAALLSMVAVSLWLLVLSLDLLRVLGRKAHSRRANRVGATLAASFGDWAVSVLDLTSLGAGVVSLARWDVGERAELLTSIPTRTGVTSVRLTAVVRNVAALPYGEWRLGLEFEALDSATANAFAEYCLIEPVWEQLGLMPDTSVTESRPQLARGGVEPAASRGRVLLRAMALLALVGAAGSTLPARANAAARPGVVVVAPSPTAER